MSGNQNISFEKDKKGQSTDIKTKKAQVKESVPKIFTEPLNSLNQEQIKAVAIKKAAQVCAIEDDINTTNKLNHSLYKEIYFDSREKCVEFLEIFFTAFIEQNKNALSNSEIENLFSHNKGYVVKLKALLLLYLNIDKFDSNDFHTFCEISTKQGAFLFTAVISYLDIGKRTNVFTAKKFMSSADILKLYTKFKEIKKFISDYFSENLSMLDIEENLKDTLIQEQLKNLNISDWGADQIKYCLYYIKGVVIHKPCHNPPLEQLIISFNESQKSVVLKRSRQDFEQFEDNAEVAAETSNKRAFLPQYMANANSSNQYNSLNSSMPVSTSLTYNSMPNLLLSSYNLNSMRASMSGVNLRPMFPLLLPNYIHDTSIAPPANVNHNIPFSNTDARLTFSSQNQLVRYYQNIPALPSTTPSNIHVVSDNIGMINKFRKN